MTTNVLSVTAGQKYRGAGVQTARAASPPRPHPPAELWVAQFGWRTAAGQGIAKYVSQDEDEMSCDGARAT